MNLIYEINLTVYKITIIAKCGLLSLAILVYTLIKVLNLNGV